MYNIPDDPVIRCVERTGHPPWEKDDSAYECPICGKECETLYVDRGTYEVLGCDNCIRAYDVWDMDF